MDNTKRNQEVIDFYNKCMNKKVGLKKWEPYINAAFERGHDMNTIKKAIHGCANFSNVGDVFKKPEYMLRYRKGKKYTQPDNVITFSKLSNLDFTEKVEEVKYKKKPRFYRNDLSDYEKMSWETFTAMLEKLCFKGVKIDAQYKRKFEELAEHFDSDVIEKAIEYVVYEYHSEIDIYAFRYIIDKLPLHASKYKKYMRSGNMYNLFFYEFLGKDNTNFNMTSSE